MKVKVYIDISVLTLATFVTGIQRVVREVILRFLAEADLEVILLHYNARENLFHEVDNKRFVDYYLYHKGKKERMITRRTVGISRIGRESVFFDLDAAWMSRMRRSYLLPVLKDQGAVIVPFLYDIISVKYPQYCLQRGVYNFMDFIGAYIQYADAVITSSQTNVTDLRELCGKVGVETPPCHVVPLGGDYREQGIIREEQVAEELAEAVREAPYLLMVGTLEPRKNHKLLLDAYEMGLKEKGYHIIFAGYMGWNMEAFQQRMVNHPDYGKGIFHFEGLSDEEITYLYQHARFLVFSSYAEGFGLPILESIMRGTPVLASDIPVSREVAEGLCIWFRQDHPEEICRLTAYYEEHEEEYLQLKEKMKQCRCSTWEEAAAGIKEALERIYREKA